MYKCHCDRCGCGSMPREIQLTTKVYCCSMCYWDINFMQCNRTLSLNLFFATVAQATPPVLGLLGCGCSVASEPVAEIIHHWNISQVNPNKCLRKH